MRTGSLVLFDTIVGSLVTYSGITDRSPSVVGLQPMCIIKPLYWLISVGTGCPFHDAPASEELYSFYWNYTSVAC